MKRLRFLAVTTSILAAIILIWLGSTGTVYRWWLNPIGNTAYSAEIAGDHLFLRRTSGRWSSNRLVIPMDERQLFRFVGFGVRTWNDYGIGSETQFWSDSRGGINVNVASTGPPEHNVEIALPLWAVILPLALLPVGFIVREFRQARRHRPGTCSTCGYDIRATPDRCPECGQAIV